VEAIPEETLVRCCRFQETDTASVSGVATIGFLGPTLTFGKPSPLWSFVVTLDWYGLSSVCAFSRRGCWLCEARMHASPGDRDGDSTEFNQLFQKANEFG
jgi:hypothetical protein